jgi:hypothetical protein
MRFHAYSVACRLFGALIILLLGLSPAHAGTDRWTTNGPYGGQVRVLTVDPETAATIFAADIGGIFKSTDGAASWTATGAVPLDPIHNRIFVQFTDSTGRARGSSSVVIETQ